VVERLAGRVDGIGRAAIAMAILRRNNEVDQLQSAKGVVASLEALGMQRPQLSDGHFGIVEMVVLGGDASRLAKMHQFGGDFILLNFGRKGLEAEGLTKHVSVLSAKEMFWSASQYSKHSDLPSSPPQTVYKIKNAPCGAVGVLPVIVAIDRLSIVPKTASHKGLYTTAPLPPHTYGKLQGSVRMFRVPISLLAVPFL